MKYFGRETRIGRLEIDSSTQNSDSPALQHRLNRISDNYSRLDQVLADLEIKIDENDYLRAKRARDEALRLAAERAAIEQQLALDLRNSLSSVAQFAPVSADPKKPQS